MAYQLIRPTKMEIFINLWYDNSSREGS